MSSPPVEWLTRREAEAAEYEMSGETDAGEDFRQETAAIVSAYAADDPAAKLTVAVDLREPSSFTDADWAALEAVRADTEAGARFEEWSVMSAEHLVDPLGDFLNGRS